MIERIDRDLDPFEGMKKTIYLEKNNEDLMERNFNDLENAIEELDS